MFHDLHLLQKKSLTVIIQWKVMHWLLRVSVHAMNELVVLFKNTDMQKAKIAGHIVQQMSFFLH